VWDAGHGRHHGSQLTTSAHTHTVHLSIVPTTTTRHPYNLLEAISLGITKSW
jgi:hypothetical protein